jgi:predicted PurR-regulated permease PerM
MRRAAVKRSIWLDDGEIPDWLRTTASAGWRVLVLAGVVVVAGLVVSRLRVVFVPLLLGLLIAAVLGPPARWLVSHRWPPLLATWCVVLAATAVVGGIGWFLVPSLAGGFAEIGDAAADAYDEVRDWLVDGPFGMSREAVDEAEAAVVDRVREAVESGIASRASLAIEVVAAGLLTLVVAFFYVKDGRGFRDRLVRALPDDARPRGERALDTGWTVLRRYLLGTVVVGTVDALLIGLGLLLVGVPLVGPLMLLTFLAAFFPMVGAIAAGVVATLVALASGGVGDALIVAAISVVVQQVDGDVLAPLVFSRAVYLHPLAVLLALTAGAVIAGIIGAMLAVPLLAVTLAMRRAWIEEPS